MVDGAVREAMGETNGGRGEVHGGSKLATECHHVRAMSARVREMMPIADNQ